MNGMPEQRRGDSTDTAPRRGITDAERRRLREADREEARDRLGVLVELSDDRGIRRGR